MSLYRICSSLSYPLFPSQDYMACMDFFHHHSLGSYLFLILPWMKVHYFHSHLHLAFPLFKIAIYRHKAAPKYEQKVNHILSHSLDSLWERMEEQFSHCSIKIIYCEQFIITLYGYTQTQRARTNPSVSEKQKYNSAIVFSKRKVL